MDTLVKIYDTATLSGSAPDVFACVAAAWLLYGHILASCHTLRHILISCVNSTITLEELKLRIMAIV